MDEKILCSAIWYDDGVNKEEFEQREVLEAAASMAGKDWLYVQLAIADYLSGNHNSDNLKWLMKTYREMN